MGTVYHLCTTLLILCFLVSLCVKHSNFLVVNVFLFILLQFMFCFPSISGLVFALKVLHYLHLLNILLLAHVLLDIYYCFLDIIKMHCFL